MSEENFLITNLEADIQVALPRRSVHLLIPIDEWDRLTERLNTCKISLHLWSVAYSVMFGIAVTAGLSIIPIAASNFAEWVLGVYTAVASASLAAAIALVIAERYLAKSHESQIDDLISDMARRRNSFMPQE